MCNKLHAGSKKYLKVATNVTFSVEELKLLKEPWKHYGSLKIVEIILMRAFIYIVLYMSVSHKDIATIPTT